MKYRLNRFIHNAINTAIITAIMFAVSCGILAILL